MQNTLCFVTECHSTSSLLYLINSTIKGKLLIIHCNVDWNACDGDAAAAAAVTAIVRPRLNVVQRARLELASFSGTLLYLPCRHALNR